MSLNVELLEQSFTVVAPQADELVETFYRHLFADFPEVQPLFAETEMAEQRKKLLASLVLVVENLRRPDVLVPTLERMGAKHVEYGAEEAHYPAVGSTLVKSLAEVAGDAWTGEMTVAWSEAIGEIAHHMLNGAAQPAN